MVATKTKLGAIAPFFIVRDLRETISFYAEKLGFETPYIGPEDDPYYAIFGRDGIQIFVKVISAEIQPMPNRSRHPWARWDAYLYVPEPEALAAEFESRGCPFSEPLGVNSDNLLGFEVTDPNGYVIYFGRPNSVD